MDDTTDKVKGKAKEAAGKITDDERLENEGEVDQAKGKLKDALDDARDAVDKLRD